MGGSGGGCDLDCNAPKYTLVVFDMFRVFFKHNLNVSLVKCETWKRGTRKFTRFKDKIVNCPKRDIKDMDYEIRGQNTIL